MNTSSLKTVGIVAALSLILLYLSAFTVDERELVIKFKLGKVVDADFTPGLHWMVPVLNNIRRFDARIMAVDMPAGEFLTIEKKNVIVDSFVKWRITDVTEFYRATRGDEQIAENRLSQIIEDALKGQFSSRTIQEAVSGERNQIMNIVRNRVDQEANKLGITIIDVRIMRIDLPQEVSSSVFERMVKERAMVAKEFRSRGQEGAKGIRADADRQREEILAEAYRTSELTKGEGDAVATAIYAQAYGRDPEFYAFYRSLNAYKNSFSGKQDMLVIDPDSQFFRYFKDSGANRK